MRWKLIVLLVLAAVFVTAGSFGCDGKGSGGGYGGGGSGSCH